MADTHRVAQSRLASGVAADVAAAFELLDPADLSGSFPRYAGALGPRVRARHAASSGLGAAFFRRVREVEGVAGVFSPLPASPLDPERLATSLAVTGPVSWKSALARGADAVSARRSAQAAATGAATRLVLDGGRSSVLRSIGADDRARGYMRVSDGSPCAFCAMLVSRGAVYKQNTATFRAHDSCGCSAVPFWEASPEQSAHADELWDLWNSTRDAHGHTSFPRFRAAYEGRNPAVVASRNRRSVVKAAEVQDALARQASADWLGGLPRLPVADSVSARAAWDAAYDALHDFEATRPEFADLLPVQIMQQPGGREYLLARNSLRAEVDKARRVMDQAEEPVYQAAKKANPTYWAGNTNPYNVNCTHVVQATELRVRGFDVTAAPLPQEMFDAGRRGRSLDDILPHWVDAEGKPRAMTSASPEAVEGIVSEWDVGARGWVTVQWKTGGAHIFNVERTPAGVRFLEGQTGTPDDAAGHLARAGSAWVMRVDDLTPAEPVLQFLKVQ